MTSTESIRIPPERLAPVAREAASNAKTVVGVLGFFTILFAIAALGMSDDNAGDRKDSAYLAGRAFGKILWFVALGAIASKFYKTGKRASAAAELAKTRSGHEFVLSGKLITVIGPGGIPDPDRSFKVSSKLRAMLLAVPRATVVD